jgi:hypothetical protein
MLAVLLLMGRVLCSPLWLLWKGYGALWWAFDDSDATPKLATAEARVQDRAQQASFEVVDSSPKPAPAPKGPLMGGFVGSLASSAAFMWGTRLGVTEGALSDKQAWMIWGWATAVVFVGSLWVVRHVARRQAAERPKTVIGKVKAAAGGLKDAAWSAGTFVAATPGKVKAAAQGVKQASEKVGAGAQRGAAAVKAGVGGTRERLDRWRFGAESWTRRVVGAAKVLGGKAKAPVTDHA